jgi:hypothetical protein
MHWFMKPEILGFFAIGVTTGIAASVGVFGSQGVQAAQSVSIPIDNFKRSIFGSM